MPSATADNVLGPPNQREKCKAGFMGFQGGCHGKGCPKSTDVHLDIGFEAAVVPAELAVFVTEGSDPVYATLTYTDNTSQDLGALVGTCAAPYKKALSTTKTLKALRLTMKQNSHWAYPQIDAVSVTSAPSGKRSSSKAA